MRITKDMLHADLQKSFWMRHLNMLYSNRFAAQIFHRLRGRAVGMDEPGISCSSVGVPSKHGGHTIRTRIYKPLDATGPLPIMLYCHGGGYIMGVPEGSAPALKAFIDKRPCIIIAPDYRKAMEHPYPAALDDCYDSLMWAYEHAAELGGMADKLMLAGHSAGGGLTAALALKLRDAGDIKPAFQMPFYPMIDDRHTTPSSQMTRAPIWASGPNRFAWSQYLAGLTSTGDSADIPAYAAPARETDYNGLPPTITYVGTIDPFLDDTNAYVQALQAAGVDVAYKTFEGCFHAFEYMVPDADISVAARQWVLDTYADFYDRCFMGDGQTRPL